MQLYRFIIINVFLLSFVIPVFAQQEAQVTHYSSKLFLTNPAFAGTEEGHHLRFFHKLQWADFPNGPDTHSFTYHGRFGKIHGLGGVIIADFAHPLRRIEGKLSYAIHLPLSENIKLGGGLSGKVNTMRFSPFELELIDPNDIPLLIAGKKTMQGDFDAGLHAQYKDYYLGFAVVNLIQSKFNFEEDGSSAQFYRHYYVQAGARFDYKKTVLEPTILLKKTAATPVQVDGGVMVKLLEEQLGFGVGYRTPGFITLRLHTVFDKVFPVTFGFDIITNRNLGPYINNLSPEITYGVNFVEGLYVP